MNFQPQHQIIFGLQGINNNFEKQMLKEIESGIWSGRIDSENAAQSYRWHQIIVPTNNYSDFAKAPAIIGFACDEGVHRNQGRTGASSGSNSIRKALANLTCSKDFRLFEYGNVHCTDGNLEDSQEKLAENINDILNKDGYPIVLGGGHEVAWASFLGIQKYLASNNKSRKLGIINFDAHFDLRNPYPSPSSGTPFRQCNEYCQQHQLAFKYFVLGINRSSNTEELFNYAQENNVKWMEDIELHHANIDRIQCDLEAYIQTLDYLYLTICMDVFNSSYAPGVSAPAALGIEPRVTIILLHKIKQLCLTHNVELLLSDIAETNPEYDRDHQTAKLAARLVYELVN